MKKILPLFLVTILVAASFPSLPQGFQIYGLTSQGPEGQGTLFSLKPDGTGYQNKYNFNSPGSYPNFSHLVKGSDGKFYGMTSLGGSNDSGVIFSYDPGTSNYAKLYSFDVTSGSNPLGSLTLGLDGKFYGLTSNSGSGYGVIFSFDPASNNYTKLYSFDNANGAYPYGDLTLAADGSFYGLTYGGGDGSYGVLFRYDPVVHNYNSLYSFDYNNGGYPQGSLSIGADGKLYGVASQGGTAGNGVIFSYDLVANNYSSLHSFDFTNGGNPVGSLALDSDGNLIGLAYEGGTSGAGVIFSYDPVLGNYNSLHSFDYTNGSNPQGNLIVGSNGKFYGMTSTGGSAGSGVLFSYDPGVDNYSNLHSFDYTNGGAPQGSLAVNTDGKFFAVTSAGGSTGSGVIFSFDPGSSNYIKLFDFGDPNGANPYGSLTQAPDGKFYSATLNGGNGAGVIFSFDPASSNYARLYSFDNTNGANPYGDLTLYADGTLYGMTYAGGGSGSGVIFKYDPVANLYSNLYSFDHANGANPSGSLVLGPGGKFYGMTRNGGGGHGVIFSYDPVAGSYNKLYSFDITNGADPYGSLTLGADGKFYGMTFSGGTNGAGVIFRYDPAAATYAKLYNFDLTNGGQPFGNLTAGADSKLYGMTYTGGPNGVGVIFRFDPVAIGYNKLYGFDISNGAYPTGSLMAGSDGKLYGMTRSGGSLGVGVVFNFDPASSSFSKIYDFNSNSGRYPQFGQLLLYSPPLPAAPVATAATSVLQSAFTAHWDAVAGITNYLFDVATDAGFTSFVAPYNNLSLGLNSITIGDLTSGTAYYYRVRSVNASGTSLNSNTITVTTLATQTITFDALSPGYFGDPPFDLSATSSSGLPVTYFSSDPSIVSVNGSTVTILNAGTVNITASQSGNAVYEAATDVTRPFQIFPFAGLPGPSISTSNITTSSFQADWSALQGAISYQLDVSSNGFSSFSSYTTTATTYTVTGLTPGTHYVSRLQAIRNANHSGYSPSKEVNTLAIWYFDGDVDGFGTPGTSVLSYLQPAGYVPDATDCNDADATVHPGAPELCDGKDNNCNGTIDENCSIAPTIAATAITFANVFSTQMRVSFTPGNGSKHLVVVRETSAVSWTPTDGQNYSANSNFSLAFDQGSGNKILSADAGTQVDITGLNPAFTYFVSVFEYNGTGTQTKYLITGAPTASKKTLALPNVFVSTPANNAVNQNVTLTVTASILSGATTYTIELNTAPDFSATSIVLNLRTQTVTGLAYNTTYYARVKTNLSPDYGKVTSFSTAAPEFFAYVTTPANGATGVSLSTSVTANAVIGATTYWIELSTNPNDFSAAIVKSGARTQSFSGLLAYNTTYYSRVRTDLSSAYGPIRSFTTIPPLTNVTSPANNAINQLWNLNLVVSAITGATSYTIRLSADPGFSTFIEKTGSTTTIAFSGLLYNTQYYSIVSTDVAPGVWGPVRTFTTGVPSFFTYLTSPADGASNVNWVTNLISNNVPNATIYTFELYTNPASVGVDPPVMTKIGTRTQAVVLAKNTTYYVRVQTDLDLTSWGVTKSFTTGDAVSLAYVTSPKNLGVGVPVGVNVSANVLSGAKSYTIELNTASDFSGSSMVMTNSKQTINFNGLAFATTYYTRVQTDLAPGQWGTISTSFTTINPAGRGQEDWRGVESDEEVAFEPFQVKIFGNPFHEKLSLLIDTPEQHAASVALFDMTGNSVHESIEQTNRVIGIEKPLAQGIYLLRIQTGHDSKVIRVMKLD